MSAAALGPDLRSARAAARLTADGELVQANGRFVAVSVEVRAVDPALTRPLRQEVLRPHESLEELATHEPPGVHAVGAFDGDELRRRRASSARTASRRVARARHGDRSPSTAAAAPARRSSTRSSSTPARRAPRASGATRARRRCGLYERAGFDGESGEFEIPGIGPHFVMARRV